MSKSAPKTVRLDEEVDKAVQRWLEINKGVGIDFSVLTNRALMNFISQKQTIELESVSTERGLKTAQSAMRKHRKAIDELK